MTSFSCLKLLNQILKQILQSSVDWQLYKHTAHLLGWPLSSGKSLFLPTNKNEYQERFQLFRDCYIHIKKVFKAQAQTAHTGSFGPLLGS